MLCYWCNKFITYVYICQSLFNLNRSCKISSKSFQRFRCWYRQTRTQTQSPANATKFHKLDIRRAYKYFTADSTNKPFFASSALKFMFHTYRFIVCFECFTGPINKPDVKTNGNWQDFAVITMKQVQTRRHTIAIFIRFGETKALARAVTVYTIK